MQTIRDFRKPRPNLDGLSVLVTGGIGYLTDTEIFDPNGGSPPFQVNWRVVANKTPMKIMDVVIEGVSLSITQRAEYAGFIQQNGGRVANLISALEKKLAELM